MRFFTRKKIQSVFDVAKSKKRTMVWSVAGGIFLIALLATWMKDTPKKAPKKITHRAIQVTPETTNYEAWQAKEGNRIVTINQHLTRFQSKSQQQSREMQQLKARVAALSETVSHAKTSIAVLNEKNASLNRKIQAQSHASHADRLHNTHPRFSTSLSTYPAEPTARLQNKPAMSHLTMSVSSPAHNRIQDTHVTHSIRMQKNRFVSLLPQGSFMAATLLTGVDAGAGSFTYHNPVPVTLRITNNAILPSMDNHVIRFHTQGCHVQATAYGSASEERVIIKTSHITCVSGDGKKVITAPFEAMVTDSDGHVGIRGKLINRQGAKLMKSFFAGFVGNIGNSLSSAQGTTSATLLGPVKNLNPSEAVRQGLYGGAGQSGNQLSQFLLKQAESIYPVIVVNSGRNVTLTIFGKDAHLTWHSEVKPFVPDNAQTKTVRTFQDTQNSFKAYPKTVSEVLHQTPQNPLRSQNPLRGKQPLAMQQAAHAVFHTMQTDRS